MALNRYIPLFSSESGAVPTASVMFDGELAVNIGDGRLYTRSGSAILHLNNTADFVSSSEQTVALLAGQDVQVGSLSTPFIDVTGSINVSGSVKVLGAVTASIFTGSFKGDGSQITGVAATALDLDNFGVDLTNNFVPSSSIMIISSASVDGRIRLTQLVQNFAGTGLETSSGALRIASTAAGPGLTGGSGTALSVNTASAHFLSGSRNAITFTDTAGPSGIDFTYINGTGSAQLVNSSITINAAAGLFGGGSVNLGDAVNLNVGAGLGIIVNLDDVELDTGSAHFNDGIKKKLNAEGVISGNAGQFATTASNVFTGAQTILDTTPSSNFNEGALVVDGGVGIQQNLNVGGDLNVLGTFSVATASFTTINSNILDVGTNKIIVNTSSSLRFGGISVNDSGSVNRSGSLYWDSFRNQWIYETELGSPYGSAILLMGPQNSSSLGDEPTLTAGRIPVAISTNNLNDSPLRAIGSTVHADNGLVVTGSIDSDLLDSTQITTDTITGTTASFNTIGIGTLLPQYPLDVRDLTGSYGIHALVGVNELDGLVVWDGTYQANHPLRNLPGLPSLDSTLVSIVTQKPYSGVSDDEYYQFVNYLNLNNYTANDNENVFAFTNYINYSSSFSQSAAVYTNTNAFTNDAGFVSTAFTNYSVARTSGELSRTNALTAIIGWAQVANSASINTSYALRAQADANISGSINTHYQVYATTNVQSSGSIRNLYGLYTTTAGLTSGQITNYVGVNSLVGNVSASNNTLVLLGTNTIPSGNWAIYDSSSYDSYFRGNLTANSFIGDGSQLTGVGSGQGFPFSGSAIITGSMVVSGSGAQITGSLSVTNGITGSLFGTASFATTASYALNASGVGFPFTGSAVITGSLLVLDSGSSAGITASFFTGSFIGDGSQLTGIPTQLKISGSSGNDVLSLLTDTLLITGSNGVTTTITDNIITIGIPCGSISSSTQIIELLPIGIVSSSVQFSTGSFTGSFNGYHTGSFTGSFYGPLIGTASYAISSSHAITASFALNVGKGDGFPFTGSAVITGSLLVLDSGSRGGVTASFFTGSFIGDGSQLTGIPTQLKLSGSTGNDVINLLTDTLLITGSNGISTIVTNNTVTVGLPTGVISSSFQINSGSFSGSFIGQHTGSFTGSFIGDGSQLTGIATSLNFSGSTSGTDSLNLKTDSLIFSGANGLSANVTNNIITYGLPTGTVSSSFQINSGSFSGSFTGSFIGEGSQLTGIATALAISGSTSGTDLVNLKTDALKFSGSGGLTATVTDNTVTYQMPAGVISSSGQFSSGSFTGSFSGSFAGVVSSSAQIGLNQISGSTFNSSYSTFTFPQNLTVEGRLTAQEFYTEFVSSSIIFESGSTKFGNSVDDVHSFTGSLNVLGTISGSIILPIGIISSSAQLPIGTVSASSQVNITQTTGYSTFSASLAAADATQSAQIQSIQNQTGSYATTGSNIFTGNQTVQGNISASGTISASSFSGNGSQLTGVTAAFVEYINVLNKPTLVSQSIQIDHDATTNFVINEHIDHSLVSITGTTGLAGGGNLTNSRTITLDTGSIHFISGSRKTISVVDTTGASGINLEYDTNLGILSASLVNSTIVVSAGSGLITGGTVSLGGSVALDVGAGNGITVTSDAVSVNTASAHFITGSIAAVNLKGVFSSSLQLDTGSAHFITGSIAAVNLKGIYSASSQVDHNLTTNYVANQHIDHTTVSISPGSGLAGGGTIAATRTLSLDTSSLHFITGSISAINLKGVFSASSQVDHNLTTNYVANQHIDHSTISITAGAGLNGGGNLTTTRTLSVDSGSMVAFYSSSIFNRVSGDILIDSSSGVATIQPNSVTLGTDTIGNYVATITAGSAIATTGATSGEGIGHTISVDTSSAHFINGARSSISVSDTTGASGIDLTYANGVISATILNSSFTPIAGNGLTGGGATNLGGSFTFDVGAGLGILSNANDIAIDTGSVHFVQGTRKLISVSDTAVPGGIDLTYDNSTGVLSGTLVTSSIGIGTTAVSLGTVVTSIAGLVSLQATSITGSLSGTATLATNVVGAANRVLYNNALNTTTTSTNLTFDGTNLTVGGQLNASTKSFMIPHKTREGKKLVYGVSEGPEHSVFVRGRLDGKNVIYLPEEWEWLIDEDSITVQLTPIGYHQKLIVKEVTNRHIVIAHDGVFSKEINCYYLIHATRKDVPKLQTIVD